MREIKRKYFSKYQKKKKESYKMNLYRQLKELNIICKICKNIKVNSTLVDCGHDFCQSCIFQYIQLFGKCKICDKQIKSFYKNYLMDDYVNNYIQQLDDQIKKIINLRKNLDQKYIPNNKQEMKFKIGMELDVLDNNFVWQQGLVKQIRKSSKKQVEYIEIQLDKKYLIIDTNERRFQKLGFYTSQQNNIVKYTDYGCKVWNNFLLQDLEEVPLNNQHSNQYGYDI